MKKKALLAVLAAMSLVACGGVGSSLVSSNDSQNTSTSQSSSTSTSSDGSSTSTSVEDEAYTIKVDNSITGVSLSVDKEKAKKGETVTVTVTIVDDGYRVTRVLYGNNECSKVNDTTYTFVMPDNPVTVKCEAVVDGDVTIQGEITAVFEEENGIYVARNVKVENTSNFDIVVKDKSGTEKKISISEFDRFKCFANIEYASNKTNNLKIAGDATYDFYYDVNNGARPCYVKRVNVDVLPNTADRLHSLFSGYVNTETSVNPDNVNKVTYKNSKSGETFTWKAYNDNTSMSTVSELDNTGATRDKAFVYTSMKDDVLTVVDTYTPGLYTGYENDYTCKDDTKQFSGEYKVASVDNEGETTDDLEFVYNEQFINPNTASYMLNSYNHNMESFETDIMYAYRVGMIVEDYIKQASVNVSSKDNGDGTFTTSIVSSKTYDSTSDNEATVKEKYHREYRVDVTFYNDGSLLKAEYLEKSFDENYWNFTSNTWVSGSADYNFENNGVIVGEIEIQYEYGDRLAPDYTFDKTPYFVNSLTNFTVNNENAVSEAANKLNVGDVVADYAKYDYAPLSALNTWQYEVSKSSNEDVISTNNNYERFQAAGEGTTTLTLSTLNGTGVSATCDVTVVYTNKLRNIILFENYGKYDPVTSTVTADVNCGGVYEFGILAYESKNNKNVPLPNDTTARALGETYNVDAHFDIANNTLIVDASKASVTEDKTIRYEVVTDYYDPDWIDTPIVFTFTLKAGNSFNDLVGTWRYATYPSDYIKFTEETYSPDVENYDEKLPYVGEMLVEGVTYDFAYNFDYVKGEISAKLMDSDLFLSDLIFDWDSDTKSMGCVFALATWTSEEQSTEMMFGDFDEEGYPVFDYFTKE